MKRIALIAMGLVLVAVAGVAGVVAQRQGERIDELEAAVSALHARAAAADGRASVDDGARLDEIERQLGFDAPAWPAEAVHERITQLEWDLGLICGYLHRTGAEVLC